MIVKEEGYRFSPQKKVILKEYFNRYNEKVKTVQTVYQNGSIVVKVNSVAGKTLAGDTSIAARITLTEENGECAKIYISGNDSKEENRGNGTILLVALLEIMEFIEHEYSLKFCKIFGAISSRDKEHWAHSLPYYENLVKRNLIPTTSIYNARLKFNLYNQDEQPCAVDCFIETAKSGFILYTIEKPCP